VGVAFSLDCFFGGNPLQNLRKSFWPVTIKKALELLRESMPEKSYPKRGQQQRERPRNVAATNTTRIKSFLCD
jgi:hypothetical protein